MPDDVVHVPTGGGVCSGVHRVVKALHMGPGGAAARFPLKGLMGAALCPHLPEALGSVSSAAVNELGFSCVL